MTLHKTIRGAVLIATVTLLGVASAACDTSPTIVTTSLPNGVVGVSYSSQLQGNDVTVWSILGGTLPTGLTLSTTGLVAGVPTAAGVFTFEVQAAADSSLTSPTVSREFSVTITTP